MYAVTDHTTQTTFKSLHFMFILSKSERKFTVRLSGGEGKIQYQKSKPA